ncbi:MAG TPA: hypothetical protein VE868_07995 [Balneolaceae bacterium]|nr:hypothetical protein [Balneolaceae bacterium]
MIQNCFNRNRDSYIFLIVLGLLTFKAFSLRAQATLGARPIALGQATTALPNSVWSVFENTAMISKKKIRVSFFGMRYYGLSNLTDLAAVITYPTKFGVIGGGTHRYGDNLFNKTRVRFVYKNSYRHFCYGAAVHYDYIMQGKGYGSVGAFGVDVGIAALIVKGLWIAAKATNINQPSYGSINNFREDLPRNLSIGFSYQLSGTALFTTDVVKDVDFPLSYRAGIEVKIIKNLKARAGVTTAPQTFSGGFGYKNQKFGADVVVQKHGESALGISPGVDFNILL